MIFIGRHFLRHKRDGKSWIKNILASFLFFAKQNYWTGKLDFVGSNVAVFLPTFYSIYAAALYIQYLLYLTDSRRRPAVAQAVLDYVKSV